MGKSSARAPAWPDYRAVWRWHFYAGLFCIPFVILLAATGAIYLFRPQIEAVVEAPYDHLAASQTLTAPSAQVRAALAVVPGGALQGYELPQGPGHAARVMVSKGADLTRVFVDPANAKVLAQIREDERPMRVLFRLHGELLSGDRGSNVVELAACWTIVMIFTGVFLWWPRGGGLAGVFWPRLTGRLWLRDLHAVTGFWVTLFALFLLLTGLPWAKNWGGYLKSVRAATGLAVERQDWTISHSEELAFRRKDDAGARAAMRGNMDAMGNMSGMSGMSGTGHEEHSHASGRGMALMDQGGDTFAPLDRAYPTVAALNLAPPVIISPPRKPKGSWSAKSDAADRPLRVDLTLDNKTGQITRRVNFADRLWLDQIIGTGVAAHEGQLFGPLNQAIGVFTALGLIGLCISAVFMWLKRKPAHALGAPEPAARPRFALGLVVIVLALGIYLPLFGASLILVLLLEHWLLRRVPPVRAWLGLQSDDEGRLSRDRPELLSLLSSLVKFSATPVFVALGLYNFAGDRATPDHMAMMGMAMTTAQSFWCGVAIPSSLASALGSMWLMYFAMALFHAGPWLGLVSHKRRRNEG